MRTPRIACALLSCLALTTLGREDAAPGDRLWEVTVDGRVLATAALDSQHVYFGTASPSAQATASELHCLSREDGATVWTRSLPNWLMASPVVTATRLYIGCDDSKLYCLDKADGEILWQFDTAGRIDSTPAIDTPGNCYFGSRDRFLYSLDPEGNLRWSRFLFGASPPLLSSPPRSSTNAGIAST